MKQNVRPSYNGEEIELTEKFRNFVIDDDDKIPVHRRGYRCSEPGLTNFTAAHPESSPSSRVYIVDLNGQFLPPCDNDMADGADQIGCRHFVVTAEVMAIPGGCASSTVEDTIEYFWYHPEQVRLRICCRMPSYKVSKIACRIASGMAQERFTGSVTAGSF